MTRDYSLNTVVPHPGTPIGYATFGNQRVEIFCSEEWRQQWFERVGTALFGPTGEDDVTASIPTGSYVADVTVAANRGLTVTGTPGPGWTPNIVQSQDLRTSATVTFANIVCPGVVDGRDVSTDGAKLDTIETGATADQSAAEILAALLTVDGSGSGLDADLLDAQSGAFYLARANHTGTQLLATISDVTMSVANLNSLDDGANTTLHFHNTDRDRANHTGTQTASTISDFNTAADARVSAGISTHEGAADPHTGYQKESEKDASSGYAGLNSSSRTTKGVDTTDDVIVDDATNGLVLKDTQGTPHYWRVTVDNTGTLVISDLGTTKP